MSYLLHYSIPVGCSVALLLLGICIVNPITNITNNSAYADDNSNNGIATYATGDTSISMTLTNGAADQKTNAETGKVASRTNGISINAANVDGYQIFVQASSGSSSNLTNGTTTISGVGSNVAYNSIPDNKWGYSLYAGSDTASATGLSYSTVPESGSTVSAAYTTNATNSATGGDKFTLAFAAKFGSSATAGEYKTNVTLSVAAGAKEVATIPTSFAGYTTMQEITKTKCDSIPIGTEGRLRDTRDNKWYWVGKLPDGLCWMTQNLEYTGYGTTTTNFSTSETAGGLFYNPGEYIHIGDGDCSPNINIGLSGCGNEGWMLRSDILATISDWAITDDIDFVVASSYPSTDGRETCTKTAGSLIGDINQYMYCNIYYYTYPATIDHYLVGVYYNWWAATASSSATVTGTVATSICPAPWKLPIGGSSTSTGSFYYLLSGLTSNAITVSPYYYVYNGYTELGQIKFAGTIGRYQSATALKAPNTLYTAYDLRFTQEKIEPAYYDNNAYGRANGKAIRCVMRS